MSGRAAPAIRRREDWPRRMHEALEAARARPFVWGTDDCCLMAADVVDAMCDAQIAARWRGRYKTARGATGLLRRRGGIGRVMERLGFDERPVLLAQRGDIVELPTPETMAAAGPMLGVCVGAHVAVRGLAGWEVMALRRGLRAWHVPA